MHDLIRTNDPGAHFICGKPDARTRASAAWSPIAGMSILERSVGVIPRRILVDPGDGRPGPGASSPMPAGSRTPAPGPTVKPELKRAGPPLRDAGLPARRNPPRAKMPSSAGFTVDAFHNGGFFLVQPAGSRPSRRNGRDAAGATIPESARGLLADLGAGAGAAGLAAAAPAAGLEVVLIERAPFTWPIVPAARSCFAENAHLAARARVDRSRCPRFRASGVAPEGLIRLQLRLLIHEPPFNSGRDRKNAPIRLKSQGPWMEPATLLSAWLRTAGRHISSRLASPRFDPRAPNPCRYFLIAPGQRGVSGA